MGFNVCVVCTSQFYRWAFCIEADFVNTHEFEMAAHLTDDVWVLPQRCHDGSFFFSFLEPLLLETFVGNVGRDPPRASSRSGPRATLSGKADAASVHP